MGVFDFLFGKKEPDKAVPAKNELLSLVEVVPGLSIPRVFADEWPQLAKTKLQAISIAATPNNDMALEQSKFGHYPYMPLDFDYPKDEGGNFMFPLAQINCSEMPPLAGCPTSGWLQFYISAFDDVFGLDFNDPQSQKNFRVLYFEESQLEQYKADYSFLDQTMESDMNPVYKPHSLSSSLRDEYVGVGDARNEDNASSPLLMIFNKYPEIENELSDIASDLFVYNGHKMGGYAYFTQQDPRIGSDKFREYILLFQLDSDKEIMWGDVGVANFFIHPDDLAKKDFSKVLFNWDCS